MKFSEKNSYSIVLSNNFRVFTNAFLEIFFGLALDPEVFLEINEDCFLNFYEKIKLMGNKDIIALKTIENKIIYFRKKNSFVFIYSFNSIACGRVSADFCELLHGLSLFVDFLRQKNLEFNLDI